MLRWREGVFLHSGEGKALEGGEKKQAPSTTFFTRKEKKGKKRGNQRKKMRRGRVDGWGKNNVVNFSQKKRGKTRGIKGARGGIEKTVNFTRES